MQGSSAPAESGRAGMRRSRHAGKAGGGGGGGGGGAPRRSSKRERPGRISQRAVAKVSYAEDDDDLDDDRPKNKVKEPIAAFCDPSELDDEVEKVIAHR